jgi:hypothetical protein
LKAVSTAFAVPISDGTITAEGDLEAFTTGPDFASDPRRMK